jgi:hypothetical protein
MKETGSRMEIWEKSFTNHRIRDESDYEKHRSYIHLNPVRAGLVEFPQDYPYSSAHPGFTLDEAPRRLKPGPSTVLLSSGDEERQQQPNQGGERQSEPCLEDWNEEAVWPEPSMLADDALPKPEPVPWKKMLQHQYVELFVTGQKSPHVIQKVRASETCGQPAD